jgi:RHS repeat-associated protein
MKVCESRVINTYTYNAAGNRTSAVLKGVSCTYTTPAAHNRLASWTGGGSMTYNTAGCVTALNRTTNKVDISSLGWDCEYQLTNVVAGATTVRYTYDVAGRKASRIQGVVTEHYLYDGIHVVADTDNSGNLLRTYTYGPGVDDILAMTIHGSGGTTNYYYLKDLANTVLALANSSGSIVESYVYDAYGNVTIRNGSGTVIPVSAYGNRFLFQGREYDYTTQLYHFRARWYDPETGRWLSNDPIGISGGLNLYAFCANNPVNFVDPMGTGVFKILSSLGKGGRKLSGKVDDINDAARLLKEGEDILSESASEARDLAKIAGDGKAPIRDTPKKHPPHYHIADRSGGHSFYKAFATASSYLTASHYAEGHGCIVENAAYVIDFFNPLSTPSDIVDIIDLFK